MKICKQCRSPKGQPHKPNCPRIDLKGMWKTRAGFFVRVEKQGIVQVCGQEVTGFLGYEIMLDGRRNGDWISWDCSGNNRERSWDLMERRNSVENVSGYKGTTWPPDLEEII